MKLKYLNSTTVWNYHSIYLPDVGFNKKSNLHKMLTKLYKNGTRGMVTVFVSRIGRNQHSESVISIYKGVTVGYDHSPRHAEYRLDMFAEEK